MGAAKVVHDFIDRVAEIDYLIQTQHKELATTRAEMAANGIRSFSLETTTWDGDGNPIDISEDDVEQAEHLELDPQAIANVKRTNGVTDEQIKRLALASDPSYTARLGRRIDWERFTFKCGAVHRAKFEVTKDGQLGIAYDGPSRDADFIMSMKRALKYGWIERFGELPGIADVLNGRAFCDWYKRPVKALMTDEQLMEDKASRMFGGSDSDDEYREAFHAENPRTAALVEDEDVEGALITGDLPGGMSDVGYAGPAGLLGIDEDALANLE